MSRDDASTQLAGNITDGWCLLINSSLVIPPVQPHTFSDVPSNNTFYPYVTCLTNQYVVSGYPITPSGPTRV